MTNDYTAPSNPQGFEDFDLTPFEREFVVHYMSSKSGAEAARKAGSQAKKPESVAYSMLQKPNVQAAINWGTKNRIAAAGIDSLEVISMLRQVYSLALEKGKYNDANKAAELLGSHLGMFRTSQIAETALKSEAHKTSNQKSDMMADIERFLSIANPSLKK